MLARPSIQIVVLFLGAGSVMSDDLLDIDQKNHSEYTVDRPVLMLSLTLTHDQVVESSKISINGVMGKENLVSIYTMGLTGIVKNHVSIAGNWMESEIIKSGDTRLRKMPYVFSYM